MFQKMLLSHAYRLCVRYSYQQHFSHSLTSKCSRILTWNYLYTHNWWNCNLYMELYRFPFNNLADIIQTIKQIIACTSMGMYNAIFSNVISHDHNMWLAHLWLSCNVLLSLAAWWMRSLGSPTTSGSGCLELCRISLLRWASEKCRVS